MAKIIGMLYWHVLIVSANIFLQEEAKSILFRMDWPNVWLFSSTSKDQYINKISNQKERDKLA